MAFTITEVHLEDETASIERGDVTYTQVWGVQFTGTYAAAQLLNTTNPTLPKYGDTKSDDSTVYCSHIGIAPEREAQTNPDNATSQVGKAVYTATFTTITYERFNLSPMARPAIIEWGGTDVTQILRYDFNGDPISNSAGDFFEDLPQFYVMSAECSITRNDSINPSTVIALYSHSNNSSSWFGVGKNNALMGKVTSRQETEVYGGVSITYYKVTYPITFRVDGWGYKTFDIGPRYVDASSGKNLLTNYTDDNGGNGLCLLDGNGKPLGDQTADPTPWPTSPDGFQVYQPRDFNSLSLPNPFI